MQHAAPVEKLASKSADRNLVGVRPPPGTKISNVDYCQTHLYDRIDLDCTPTLGLSPESVLGVLL